MARNYEREYINSVTTPENIAKAGGKKQFDKIVRKWKREQTMLKLKGKLYVFWLDVRVFVIIGLILLVVFNIGTICNFIMSL